MAYGLKGSTVEVQQALHGYSDGHRLLASSTNLKPRDQKAMLVMSDVSGPNAVIDESGYVTGYPLSESGFYALACTWSATEMARPGCVWTHTLLIDFADLAALPEMNFLVSAFLRPKGGGLDGTFQNSLKIPVKAGPRSRRDIDDLTLRRIASALYSHPKERIIASAGISSLEVAFLFWAQQWPRLRRTFRFCTLSFGDRSAEGSAFDLQFIPARERSVRSRFSSLTDAERIQPPSEDWLEAAISDLNEGTTGKLRRFLRTVGSDLAGGREAFIPLCRLYQLIPQFGTSGTFIDDALRLLDKEFDPASANSVRTVLVSAIAQHPYQMSREALTFLFRHLDQANTAILQAHSSDIGRAVWSQAPDQLMGLLDGSSVGQQIAEQALQDLDKGTLLVGLRRMPYRPIRILEKRPDLLEESELWKAPAEWQENAIAIAAEEPNRIHASVRAMLFAGRADLAPSAVRAFGGAKVLSAIGDLRSSQSADISAWLQASVSDPSAVAEALRQTHSFDRTFLALIARQTQPDFVPNTIGEDPWWTSIQHARGEVNEELRQYLAAYLFARALGHCSRNQADLFVYAFDDLYLPALHARVFMDAWYLVEPRLPKPWLFFDWDYCQRIRDGLVDVFLSRELSASSFTKVTQDDQVFTQLARSMARTGKGRRFLMSARHSLLQENSWSPRLSIIDNLL